MLFDIWFGIGCSMLALFCICAGLGVLFMDSAGGKLFGLLILWVGIGCSFAAYYLFTGI
jgi:hypothetical protein